MRFLLTRPLIDSEPTAALLRQQNHTVLLDPVIQIKSIETGHIAYERYQALLFTSANAIRAHDFPDVAKNILTFVVGAKTEKAAAAAGFRHVISGGGNVEALAEKVKSTVFPKNGPLAYLHGADISRDLGTDLASVGFEVTAVKCYEATASEALAEKTRMALENGEIDFIPFYSPRSALIFKQLVNNAAMEDCLKNTVALCLSPAVAVNISSLAWKNVKTAETPNQYDLFKLINIEF